MTSALESDYIEPSRPYSQSELKDMRLALYRNLRLGLVTARHEQCGHMYLTKQNGRKEKEIRESSNEDVGKCSACWKISKTPRQLRNKATNLALDYRDTFSSQPAFLSYHKIDLETVYYKWLYEDFN